MADIINLNKARKNKARAEAQAKAAENRLRFGRTKQQKALDAARVEDAQHKLDLLKRDVDGAPGDEPKE